MQVLLQFGGWLHANNLPSSSSWNKNPPRALPQKSPTLGSNYVSRLKTTGITFSAMKYLAYLHAVVRPEPMEMIIKPAKIRDFHDSGPVSIDECGEGCMDMVEISAKFVNNVDYVGPLNFPLKESFIANFVALYKVLVADGGLPDVEYTVKLALCSSSTLPGSVKILKHYKMRACSIVNTYLKKFL